MINILKEADIIDHMEMNYVNLKCANSSVLLDKLISELEEYDKEKFSPMGKELYSKGMKYLYFKRRKIFEKSLLYEYIKRCNRPINDSMIMFAQKRKDTPLGKSLLSDITKILSDREKLIYGKIIVNKNEFIEKKIDNFDWEQGLKEISKAVFKDDDFLYSSEDKKN